MTSRLEQSQCVNTYYTHRANNQMKFIDKKMAYELQNYQKQNGETESVG